MLNLVIEGAALLFGFAMMPLLSQPEKPSSSYTAVRVGLGKAIDEDRANIGGNRPGIALFDVGGHGLGHENGGDHLQAGDYHDYHIEMPKDNRGQAQYISVTSAGNDAVCVSYVTVTFPDGLANTWYGDYAWTCGGDWYYSETIVNAGNYKPKCAWLDGDASNGHTTTGWGMRIIDFVVTPEHEAQWQAEPELLCSVQPRFWQYEHLEIKHWLPAFVDPPPHNMTTMEDLLSPEEVYNAPWITQGEGPPPNEEVPTFRVEEEISARSVPESRRAKRHAGIRPNQSRFCSELVTSHDSHQSAAELCASDTSKGPDFVSYSEGLFCDMSEKQLWPLCAADAQKACFDAVIMEMRPGTGISGRDEASGRVVPAKSYKKVSNWA